MIIDIYLKQNVPNDVAIKLAFIHLYKQIQLEIADPKQVEEMIIHIYNNDCLLEKFKEDQIMWKKLQIFKKYMTKFGVYFREEN